MHSTLFKKHIITFVAANALLAPLVHGAGPALLDNGTSQAATTVRIEAESAFAAPFVAVNNQPESASASGGSYIAVPDGGGAQPGQPTSGSDYGIDLAAGGDLALWARVWTPDAGSDAFWFRFDSAGAWQSWVPGVNAGWSWRRVAIMQFAAGPHVLNLAHQDDGVRLDALLFTSDLNLIPGNGLAFSGDSGVNRHHVEIPAAIPATDALTIEAWVNLDANPAGNWDPIIAKGGEWAISRYKTTNKIAFRTGGDDLISLGELQPGSWYHLAATIGGGTKRLYINGVVNRSKSDVGALAPGSAQLRFGANINNVSAVYRGRLDEVRVWSVARSAAQIVANQNGIPKGDETGLEGFWRFETTGLTAVDASAAGRNGQLKGFVGGTPLRIDGVAMSGPSQAISIGGQGPGGLDVVAGNESQPNRLYLGNGGADPFGGATGKDLTADAHSTSSVALGDVDGDGYVDMVAGNMGQANRLYLNNGSIDPFAGVVGSDLSANPKGTRAVALGDVDGDGDLDLVEGNSGQPNRLFLNNGSADPFAGVAGTDIPGGGYNTHSVALGDVDGDGDLDLVEGNSGQANRLYLNNGSADPFAGVVGSNLLGTPDSTESVALGDVDGDGDLDLVGGIVSFSRNRLYLNNGTADPFAGVVGVDLSADQNRTHSVALGDVDGDGDLDMVAGNQNQRNRLYLNNGSADPFLGVAGKDVSADDDFTQSVALGDVDGDGDLDMVAGNYGPPNRLYLNNGSADPFAGVAGTDVSGDANNTNAVALGDIAPLQNPNFLSGDPAVENRFDFTESLTVETWLRFDVALTERVPLVAKGTASSWGLYLTPVGRIAFETPGSGPVDVLQSDTVLAPGEWHHVAVTLEPVDGSLLRKVIYLDGGIDASKDDVPRSLATNNEPLICGGNGSSGLLGALDEIRIWDRTLAPETIAAQFARNLNGLEPGLALLWRMDVAEPMARNSALNGPTSGGLDGILEGRLTENDYIPGVALGPALTPQFSLFFDGTESVQIPHSASLNFSPALTLEVWVRPTEQRPSTIVVKGSSGYGLGLDGNLRPVFFEGADLAHSVSASATIPLGEWTHLAVVAEQAPGGGPNGRTTFFINGQEAGAHSQGVIVNNTQPLYLGRGGTVFPEYFIGEIDELRLWGAGVSPAQIAILAQLPLPDSGAGFPGLTAYWGFDEGTGAISTDRTPAGRVGALVNMDESNWRFGHDFGVPGPPAGLNLQVNPTTKGLWIGQVALIRVNEAVAIDPENLANTGDAASIRILLHVDDNGRVRLLKDVVVMKRRNDANDPDSATSVVLVTDPSLIPNFEGLVRRDGKVVGLRYGSAAYDFSGLELQLLGGIGPALGCAGTIHLAANAATNPYRHKFHPQHQLGYAINRSISISFDGDPGDPLTAAPGFGVDRITGTYRETVTGLHKLPIRVQGGIELTRISEVGTLNN
ncbi:MAG: FG-GAP-like repeat-containing protein [Akkermansiaceae bacterium]|nr:FG-GAP-like repeat-containing protein [Akkermansiaceae bacterium]